MINQEVYVSYAWNNESKAIVERLDQALQLKGITLILDRRDLGYKGRIREFMERIGRAKCVVVIISDKYLKSANCMFELLQIAENGKFYDRVFPIVLSDAQIYKPTSRIEYVRYWEEQIRRFDMALRSVSSANLQGFRDEIDIYAEIRKNIAELTYILKDINSPPPEIHNESDFAELIQIIEQRVLKPTDEIVTSKAVPNQLTRKDVLEIIKSARSQGRLPELRNVKLVGIDLNGENLSGVDFTKADLSFADLEQANLEHTIFQRATLDNAILVRAHMKNANLRRASLKDTNLYKPTLTNADLSEIDLKTTKVDFDGAHLDYSKLFETDLSGHDLTGAILTGAEYSNSTVWPDDFDPKKAGAILK